MPTIVSHSEVEAFLGCRKRHYFAHGEKLMKKPTDGKFNAAERGTAGHAMLDAFFNARKDGQSWDAATKAANNFINMTALTPGADMEACTLVKLLVNMLLDNYRERIEGWEILHVEQEFWLDLGGDIKYPFKPDLIVRENGYVTVMDYKFAADYYSPDMMSIMPQLPKYMGALRAMGIEVTKAAYIFLRTRSKNIESKSVDEVVSIKQVTINNDRLKNTWYEQIAATQEIAQYKALPLEDWERRALRSINKDCSWCPFRDLCSAMLQGSDGVLMREMDYTANTYGYSEKKPETEK